MGCSDSHADCNICVSLHHTSILRSTADAIDLTVQCGPASSCTTLCTTTASQASPGFNMLPIHNCVVVVGTVQRVCGGRQRHIGACTHCCWCNHGCHCLQFRGLVHSHHFAGCKPLAAWPHHQLHCLPARLHGMHSKLPAIEDPLPRGKRPPCWAPQPQPTVASLAKHGAGSRWAMASAHCLRIGRVDGQRPLGLRTAGLGRGCFRLRLALEAGWSCARLVFCVAGFGNGLVLCVAGFESGLVSCVAGSDSGLLLCAAGLVSWLELCKQLRVMGRYQLQCITVMAAVVYGLN